MSTCSLDERGLVFACPRCGQPNRVPYERLDQRPRCGKCQESLTLPATPIDADTTAGFAALIRRSALPVLVDFWAAWCGPCKMIAPEVAAVARQEAGRWVVVKLNTELLPEVAQQFSVASIPLLVIFHQGRELARQAGAMPAANIRQFLRSHLPAS